MKLFYDNKYRFLFVVCTHLEDTIISTLHLQATKWGKNWTLLEKLRINSGLLEPESTEKISCTHSGDNLKHSEVV